MLQALPIDAHLDAIAAAVRAGPSAVIKAAPGAGKTTRVPPALLGAVAGRIVVLEPRRLAARLSAERVASELGEAVGATVGYQIRFDVKASAATRIVYVTEGVFMRRALDDPRLAGVDCVIIDEFHERHIHTDLALAIVRKLQRTTRPDLKLVVMSATLDTGRLAAYLPEAAGFDVEGRAFPVAVEYLALADDAPVDDKVAAGVARILADPRCDQDVLVFLTGIREILRCADTLRARSEVRAAGADVLPLTAELPPAEQQRVFAPSPRRKIILATNVAETSLTLPGITGVVDAGRAKIAGHAAWSGLPTLEVKRVSQAACIQRAGRAGRVRPGVCYRLFAEGDFLGRPAFTPPDIARLDFADTLLGLLALRAAAGEAWTDVRDALPWFEAPDDKAVDAAWQLLTLLGVVDGARALTAFGARVARLPLHPRLGAVCVRGQDEGIAAPALLAACMIGEGMILSRGQAVERSDSDVALQLEVYADVTQGRRLSSRALEGAVDRGAVQQVRRSYEALARRAGIAPAFDARAVEHDKLAVALLAGFPDRVARRRQVAAHNQKPGERPLYNFCLGRGGVLADSSAVSGADLILVLDASEALGAKSKDRSATIHVAAALTVDALLASPADLLSERTETVWSDDAQRVDVWTRLYYGQIVVSESRATVRDVDRGTVEEMLREKLAERWPKPFDDDSDLRAYHERVRHLEAAGLGGDFPRFEGEMLELLMAAICEGKRSFKEIAERSLADYVHEQLPYEARRALTEALPAELALPNGRRLKVVYEDGRPPHVAGFIQDFYGTRATPALLSGRLPLTLHLLAPNRRPIQVTSDLEGFWKNHYPALRQELGRNYPKHYWPEEPRTAEPVLHKSRVR